MSKNKPSPKILIAGGHITPALALIKELEKRGRKRIIVVGRKYAFEGDSGESFEFKSLKGIGVEFIPLVTGRILRSLNFSGVVSLLKIPQGFISAYQILPRIKPDIIVSFGGYVAFPIIIVGHSLRIPILIHEQTLSPGITNRLTAWLADLVCISWPKTERFFPTQKVIRTGNPIRPELFEPSAAKLINTDLPMIYVTGGSSGSQTINRAVGKIIPELIKHYVVIHQVGSSTLTKDMAYLLKVRDGLEMSKRQRYVLREHLNVRELAWVYKHADLIISRAGANTVTEIALFGIPAILIPLPWSGGGEQQAQAAMLADTGLAKIVAQEGLDTNLINSIHSIVHDLETYKKCAIKARELVEPQAARNLADAVDRLLESRR